MANIKKQVASSLKWKKNTTYCASKLGISESKYLEIKQELKLERKTVRQKSRFFSKAFDNAEIAEAIDLEKGEGKISGTFDHEPKSPEEIIQLLNIDTSIWKLSQYWNKQMGDHWRVSALVSRKKESASDNLEELLKDWSPKTFKVPKVDLSKIKNGLRPNLSTVLKNIVLMGIFTSSISSDVPSSSDISELSSRSIVVVINSY